MTELTGEQAAPESAGAARARATHRSALREYAETLLVTILLALFGTTFVVQAFKIPSPSMEPTLLVGDHLLVNKFIFGGSGAWYERLLPYRPIRRGDILVFKFPFEDHEHFVKRVIGLPGDRVRIVREKVYVNGFLLNEPYVLHDPAAVDPFADDFPPVDRYFSHNGLRPEWAAELLSHVRDGELVVPADRYFVLGDNRDHSWDSRYWGFVRRDSIMGRPVIIYWSVQPEEDDASAEMPSRRVVAAIDWVLHLPGHARWSRMFHEVH